MAIIFKPILPKPVKDKAMKAVLATEVRKYAPYIKNDFEKTVAGWKRTKPVFAIKFNSTSAAMSLSVSVTGNKDAQAIWGYLDQGTKPHIIRPRKAKYLRFKSGKYSAGSTPGRLNTYNSSPASGPDVFRNVVHHPGFPARKWLKAVKDAHEKPFAAWMQAAMAQAANVSGHKI